MAKDPAVLFYYQDFLVGTQFMTDAEVGAYMRLLCHQADKGPLTESQVMSICSACGFTKNIQDKFERDANGNFFNRRMRQEKEKRSKYVDSRRSNASTSKAYASHMEDENENENRDKDQNINRSPFPAPSFGSNPGPLNGELKEIVVQMAKEINVWRIKHGLDAVPELLDGTERTVSAILRSEKFPAMRELTGAADKQPLLWEKGLFTLEWLCKRSETGDYNFRHVLNYKWQTVAEKPHGRMR